MLETIKATILEDDDNLPSLFVCTIYYTNTVHILSTFTEKIPY